jgi:hypothetical protein
MADEENANMEDVAVEEQPSGDEPAATKADAAANAVTNAVASMDGTQLPLAITLIGSIILLIATGAKYGWKYNSSYAAYAISISSITLSLSAICLLMHKFMSGMYEKVGKKVCMTNFLWAFIGACFLTFREPFTGTGNGYFAAWITVLGCAMSMGMDHSAFKSTVRGLGSVMGHLAASVVFLVSCIPKVDSLAAGSKWRNNAIYGLSLACFSTLCMLAIISMDKKGKPLSQMINLVLMVCLSFLWLVAACLVTFDGPFTETSNGYFSAWAGMITAMYAASAARK